jgi:hypothetical protein
VLKKAITVTRIEIVTIVEKKKYFKGGVNIGRVGGDRFNGLDLPCAQI